jgi:hypothetical protein
LAAVYLINLSPSYPLQGDVPNKVFYGKEVSYDHLKVFGCKAFVHIPQDERSKLDSKTRQCIFLGYGGDQFSYNLFDPIARKVVRSRDVVFVEDQTIKDIVKTKKKVPESIPVGVPPQRQQQDRDDSDPEPADSAQQEAENDDVEDVQDDAHSGTGGEEDAPQQQEYDDAEENDHDQ